MVISQSGLVIIVGTSNFDGGGLDPKFGTDL